MFNFQPGTIVQFAHDSLFLSIVRLKNGQPVLGLTSRPTDWTIPSTTTVNGLLKLVGPAPASNCEMQWAREADDLIHVTSRANQSTFLINFANGSSSACTLMSGDSFFGIRPHDGKFVVHIVSARPEATRFNVLFPSYAQPCWQDGGRQGHAERESLQARYPLV